MGTYVLWIVIGPRCGHQFFLLHFLLSYHLYLGIISLIKLYLNMEHMKMFTSYLDVFIFSYFLLIDQINYGALDL